MKRIIVALTLIIALSIPASVTAQVMEVMRQEGIASWYGPEFDGRPTASGEIFNSALLTAAHPTLPFGTIVIVTNRHNNRQVTVRINDRGPFVAGRIIDVSRAAAEQLEMLVTGTAPVVVDVIRPTAQATAPQTYTPPPAPPPVQPQHPGFTLPPVSPPPTYQPQQPLPPVVPPQPPYQPQPPVPPPPVPPIQQPLPPVQAQPLPTHPPTPPLPPIQPATPPGTTQQHPQVTITQGTADSSAPITVTIFPSTQSVPLPPFDIPHTTPPPQGTPQAAVPLPPLPVPDPTLLPPMPPVTGARLVPAINPSPNRTYTLQIGSFRVARNAVDTFTKLREAGLTPEYERHNDFYRVVIKGIRGADVQSVAERLERAGFQEAIIREE